MNLSLTKLLKWGSYRECSNFDEKKSLLFWFDSQTLFLIKVNTAAVVIKEMMVHHRTTFYQQFTLVWCFSPFPKVCSKVLIINNGHRQTWKVLPSQRGFGKTMTNEARWEGVDPHLLMSTAFHLSPLQVSLIISIFLEILTTHLTHFTDMVSFHSAETLFPKKGRTKNK